MPMDLEFFMPPEKIAQALKVLDVDGDGKISLADMRDAVIQVRLHTLCHAIMHPETCRQQYQQTSFLHCLP